MFGNVEGKKLRQGKALRLLQSSQYTFAIRVAIIRISKSKGINPRPPKAFSVTRPPKGGYCNPHLDFLK